MRTRRNGSLTVRAEELALVLSFSEPVEGEVPRRDSEGEVVFFATLRLGETACDVGGSSYVACAGRIRHLLGGGEGNLGRRGRVGSAGRSVSS
jgi:hypothetical protein